MALIPICKVSISGNTNVTESFPGTVADSHSQHRVDHRVIQTSTSMPHTALFKVLQHGMRSILADRPNQRENTTRKTKDTTHYLQASTSVGRVSKSTQGSCH